MAAMTLRADLEADLAELAQYDATDWLRAVVDTVLVPGLVVRATLHACAYAIDVGERGAETTISAFDSPIAAPKWTRADAVRASLLGPLVVAGLTTPLASLPEAPLAAVVVGLQCVPLAGDPALTLLSSSPPTQIT